MILENCSYLRDARVGKEARALSGAGYKVSVISPEKGWRPSRTLIEGVVIYGFPHRSFPHGTLGYFVEYAYATVAIAAITLYIWATDGFDILHVANPPDCIVPVAAIYRLLGKRVIYDQHDLSPELYRVRFPRPNALLLRLQLLLERLSHKLSNHTIVTNESYRALALSRGGCSPSHVTVVRNGPDLDLLRTLDVDADLRKKSPYIFAFAGITGFQDGLEHLCRALRSLRFDLRREDFLCIVIGDGEALQDMKDLSTKLGLEKHIWFAGWVSDPVLYFRYLSTADICVAPDPSNCYNDHSTFVKLMEYMLAGKPIVAFDLPESRFSAGHAASYVTPNDEREFALKLAQLMDNPELRRSMGEFGRRRIETGLAWQHSIPELLAVYTQVFGSQSAVERSRHATSGVD
jgi:glycosyltransferase involved in cell wall biosynthesis